MLSTRRALLAKANDLAKEVRGLLKICGIWLLSSLSHGRFDDVVRPLAEMDDIPTHALLPRLNVRHATHAHFLELDRWVKQAARRN